MVLVFALQFYYMLMTWHSLCFFLPCLLACSLVCLPACPALLVSLLSHISGSSSPSLHPILSLSHPHCSLVSVFGFCFGSLGFKGGVFVSYRIILFHFRIYPSITIILLLSRQLSVNRCLWSLVYN